jgi:hypothetical protein
VRWNQCYCQDPECRKEVARWQAAKRQQQRRRHPEVRQQHAADERERKAEFYRALVRSLLFFGGSPRQLIFDNLKAAVLNGSGRQACLHPEFLALCGHYCLEPIACARRDPESKGIVEAGVRYVKQNALQGRSEELARWEDYPPFAIRWRDETANVRVRQSTGQLPVDRFQEERGLLRPLPVTAFDTDEMVSVVVSSHARVRFDSNRYSVPPQTARKTLLLRASDTLVRVLGSTTKKPDAASR